MYTLAAVTVTELGLHTQCSHRSFVPAPPPPATRQAGRT